MAAEITNRALPIERGLPHLLIFAIDGRLCTDGEAGVRGNSLDGVAVDGGAAWRAGPASPGRRR